MSVMIDMGIRFISKQTKQNVTHHRGKCLEQTHKRMNELREEKEREKKTNARGNFVHV